MERNSPKKEGKRLRRLKHRKVLFFLKREAAGEKKKEGRAEQSKKNGK